jgi:putative flavoprotein involved in K+ transport
MDGGGSERFETVIVGAGQAGLSAGYYLQKASRFVILDAHARVGDNWRERYDSLRLFTPAYAVSLPGWRFPAKGFTTPLRDDMANYLEAYATKLALPVRTGVQVDDVRREGDTYVVTAGAHRFEAANVIVASGAHREPRVPALARELDPSIVQLHSTEYRNPTQLRDGGVLVVGAGNSGADISLETVVTRPTWLAGRIRGHIPFDIDTGFAPVTSHFALCGSSSCMS